MLQLAAITPHYYNAAMHDTLMLFYAMLPPL